MNKHPILWTLLIICVIFLTVVASVITLAFRSLSGSRSASFGSDEPVVVVQIEDTIMESLDVLKELEDLRTDDDVKAVVLRLDSPGGAVAPSQEIYQQVLKLKKSGKIIVVSMGTVAASGAYYIGCAADKIVANPGTITGSIGVIMESVGLQELVKKFALESRVIKSGPFKDAGNPFRDMTETERTYFQDIVNNMYEQFLTAVSENRKIAMDKLRTLAQGKVYTGLQAKEFGLVDELGNIYDAIDLAKKLANLSDDAGVRWPREPSAWEKIWKGDEAGALTRLLFKGGQGLRLPAYQLQ